MTTPDINALLKADPRSCRYGAPLGCDDYIHEDWDNSVPLHVQRLRFIDGDYAADGTYWGAGSDALYCAFDPTAMQVRIYVRAHTRGGALRKLRKHYPELTFHRPNHTS